MAPYSTITSSRVLIFGYSRVTQQPLTIQQTIYQSRNPTRRWLHNRRRQWIENAISEFADRHVTAALEIGPGSGIYLPALASVAEKVLASDVEPVFLRNAESMSAEIEGLSCIRDDITDSKLPHGQFDLILCTEVIEHILDSPSALQHMARLLSSEGRLILTTPQAFSPLELCGKVAFLPGIVHLLRWIYGEAIEDTGHINLLTSSGLLTQLEDAGLEVQSAYKCGFYLPVIAEFFGTAGLRSLQFLEQSLRDSFLDGLLWTQCYIVSRAVGRETT